LWHSRYVHSGEKKWSNEWRNQGVSYCISRIAGHEPRFARIRLEIKVIVTVYLPLWSMSPALRVECEAKEIRFVRLASRVNFLKLREMCAYKYGTPRSVEKCLLTSRRRHKHDLKDWSDQSHSGAKELSIGDPFLMFSYSHLIVYD